MSAQTEARERTRYTRQQVIEQIRERIKAGPPGWEDITKRGYAYHETTASFEVDWIMDILNEEAAR